MITTKLLAPGDEVLAGEMFELMNVVFDAEPVTLDPGYIATLLRSEAFMALAGFIDGRLAGGATAHVLPMTRDQSSELFVYDIAVRESDQRKGIGRRILQDLLAQAAARGVTVAFVPADNEDEHALRFYERLGGAAAPVTIYTFER